MSDKTDKSDKSSDKHVMYLGDTSLSGAAGYLNTFPAYDVLGRTLFMGFRLTF